MNKFTLILAAFFFSFTAGHAQNLLSKVPSKSSMVIKYSGENFTTTMPLKKLESYPFVKENLFKMLKVDSLTTLESSGIDFKQDVYQYAVTEDSTMNFVTLLHLTNVQQFLKLVDAHYGAELKPVKKNGYEFLSVSSNTYVGWNNEWAIIVLSNYSNPNRYNYYWNDDAVVAADSVFVGADSTMPMIVEAPKEEIVIAPAEETPKTKAPTPKKKSPAGTKKGKKKTSAKPKKAETPPPPVFTPPDIVMDEEVTTTTVETPNMSYYDSVQQAQREARWKEIDRITAERQKKVSEDIIENSFNKPVNSIENGVSYKKIIDPAAHISAWFNYEDLMRQYWSAIYSGFLGGYNRYRYNSLHWGDINSDSIGLHSSLNVYFDKDKMRVEQKTFSADGETANLSKELYNSKQNTDLVKFVNPDNIGYLSASVNTEALEKYYYKWIRAYMNNNFFTGKYSDVVDVYLDLLEIVIDEKAIADLMPGNYLFVMHDMKTKMVSYTDYVYDDNFKFTEVQKTKQELTPNFTFVMETRNEKFMKKLANLPLKYAKKENYNYQDKGGYYELLFDSSNTLNSLYFLVKDGKVVVTTSKASIDIALNNTKGYDLDTETKNSILKNNYSLKLNSKRLIQQVGPELNTGVNKKVSDYLQANLGDFKMESSLKDGIIQGTITMGITGSHLNSLEAFFDMIDAINKIIKEDKEVKEQKFD